ncbi:MAG: phospho-N-acetylmuramoyl-pentapeptide-transferase [Campylobacterales bacterium]|nr:phospho-N-acetylmuramoyl-pentapeptide-transferase [Campylobacterales bacterium]
MLYLFSQHLDINIFSYITVRAGIAFFLAFAFTLIAMPKFIRWAKNKKATQPIYVHAPDGHKHKKNTPTMGGLIFIIAIFLAAFISADISNPYVIITLLTIVLFGGIGIFDDYKKIFNKKNEEGLTSRQKLKLQTLSAFIVSSLLIFWAEFPTDLYLPFFKSALFDMGLFSILFWTLIIVGSSNAVNLTDGLDGLATVPSIFAFITLALFIYISGHAILSQSLLIPKVTGIGEVTIIASAFIGGLIGFLWFNANPAEVFMGDSGSLTLGAVIGYMGVLAKSEFLLLLIGFIFVIETLSVIIQVWSYKTRKKRPFLMAPLHHHFELKKWAENKIIVRFWIVSLLSNLLAILTIKIR